MSNNDDDERHRWHQAIITASTGITTAHGLSSTWQRQRHTTRRGQQTATRLEHADDPLGHLVVLPARLEAAQRRRRGHARRPPHVPTGPAGPLLVDQVDHRLQRVLALRDSGVRRQLVAQPLDFELLGLQGGVGGGGRCGSCVKAT